MAVPLIITVTPNEGVTSANNIVDLLTNNARLPPDPPETGFVGGSVPVTVEILFGTVPATNVQVISRGRVICRAPAQAAGVVDVTITNLDDLGVAIPGETFTKASAYTYKRPNLFFDPDNRSDLTRIVENLIVTMREQILENVGLTTHTDYDEETGDYLNIAEMAKLPAIVLTGPDMTENRFYSINNLRFDDAASGVEGRRNPYTVDLRFGVIGATDNTRQLIELLYATVQFFHRNRTISMLCDQNDPSAGAVKFDMDFIEEGGEPEVTSRLGESNVRTFSGTVLIRGFNLEDFHGVDNDTVVSLTERITEVAVGMDLPIIVAEEELPSPYPPLSGDIQPEAPNVGDFDIVIEEHEAE